MTMNKTEKVKVIANHYFDQGVDVRSRSEILEQMQDWASRGWLSKPFIEDCYAAIAADKEVRIEYLAHLPAYSYLAGTPEAFDALARSKGPIKMCTGNDNEQS